ncbi:hypothetical protein JOM56_011372 [Amanita muscaria]
MTPKLNPEFPSQVYLTRQYLRKDAYIIQLEQLWFFPSMTQDTSNQTSATESPSVNTSGAAYFGNATFTGGGHAFGNNSTVNNTQDYSKRTIHDNSNNKGIIGGGSNNTVNSGDNSGNQTQHNYGGNKQYNQTISTLQGNANMGEGQRNYGSKYDITALNLSAPENVVVLRRKGNTTAKKASLASKMKYGIEARHLVIVIATLS